MEVWYRPYFPYDDSGETSDTSDDGLIRLEPSTRERIVVVRQTRSTSDFPLVVMDPPVGYIVGVT